MFRDHKVKRAEAKASAAVARSIKAFQAAQVIEAKLRVARATRTYARAGVALAEAQLALAQLQETIADANRDRARYAREIASNASAEWRDSATVRADDMRECVTHAVTVAPSGVRY